MDSSDSVEPAPSRRRRLWPFALAMLVVMAVATAGVARLWVNRTPDVLRTGPVDSPLLGEPAPDFDLPALDDAAPPVGLAGLRGQPVVINFWASWCVPCRQEMPGLESLHQQYSSCVSFVGIDHLDERGPAAELVAETGVTYPSGFDPSGTVARDYGLYGLPSTVLVAADGTVHSVYLGPIDANELGSMLASLAGRVDGSACPSV